MENKSSSQAPAAGDATLALRSSTNVLPKRPLVKPDPPKTSSLTRPTAASATKTSSASGLSKPPTRPTTISSVRKAPSTSIVASGHQKRASLASADALTSGDEKKKATGLSAKPKRVSLAPTTVTPASRATAATAASRRSTIQPSPTTERKPFVRQSAASPTKTRTVPSTLSSRITPTTSSRTKPLASSTSSLRSAGVSDGKKRLSTIPASPAVKSEPKDDDKENALEDGPEALAATPAITEDVEISEALSGTEENTVEHEPLAVHDGEFAALKAELAKSQATVTALTTDLEQLRDKVALFSKSAEEESQKVQDATEAIRNEHVEKIESLIAAHQQEIATLHADASDSVEQERQSHAEETASLKAELEGLQASLAEVNGNAGEIESLRSAQATQLEALQKQIKDLKLEATTSKTSAAALSSELAEVNSKLAKHAQSTHDVESLKSTHAKELEFAKQQTKDAETTATAHETDSSRLRAELAESRAALSTHQELSALDIKKDDHESALRKLEEAKSNEIDSLRQSHEEKVGALQTQIEEAARESTASVSQQAAEISHLGEVIEKLQNEIQARDDANVENTELRVAAIKDEHAKAMAAALDGAKSSSLGEVESLRTTLSAEYQTTIDELQAELANAHEQASKSSQDAQNAAEEQVRVLESKVRSLSEETEGYKMQSQTFKQILSASEKETQEKDEEHAEAISKLQDDVATSVKRATEQQMKVMEISSRLDQEVAKRAALEGTHAKTLEDLETEHQAMKSHHEEVRGSEIKNLKEQHAATIKEYRNKEGSLTRQVDELQTKHDSAHTELEAQKEAHGLLLKDLQSKHDADVKKVQEHATIQQQELDSLRAEHANAGDSTKVLKASHKQELEALEAKYEQAVKELNDRLNENVARLAQLTSQNAAHSEAMKALETSHAEKVEALNTQLNKGMSDIQSSVDGKDAELAKLNAQYAESLQKLEMASRRDSEFEKLTIQNTNMATELKSIEASHSAYLEEIRKGYLEEIKAAESGAKAHTTELQRLKEEKADLNKGVDLTKEAHVKAINTLKSDHADQLTKLQSVSKDQATELNKLKMQRGLAAEEAKKMEAAHKKELTDLQSQHAATMEAMADAQVAEVERMKKEQSRAPQATASETTAAESVKSAELVKEMQIKIAHLEAELALSSKTGTKSPKKKKSKKSIKDNGSPGLAQSKWADSEPATPVKESKVEEPSYVAATDISSTVPTPAPAVRSHNIEGQLAGMQEQLKHLDDIDAEMLEQHERMARTLSRVEDTTASPDKA